MTGIETISEIEGTYSADRVVEKYLGVLKELAGGQAR